MPAEIQNEEYQHKYRAAIVKLYAEAGKDIPKEENASEPVICDEFKRVYHPPIRTGSGVRFGYYK